jgi:hypothetical protein
MRGSPVCDITRTSRRRLAARQSIRLHSGPYVEEERLMRNAGRSTKMCCCSRPRGDKPLLADQSRGGFYPPAKEKADSYHGDDDDHEKLYSSSRFLSAWIRSGPY